MGGTIWIDSEPGKGSTFTFTVQARRGAEKEPDSLSLSVDWNSIRILAVDDTPDVLMYFNEIMRGFGLSCDTANSGEEAIRLVERNGAYHIYFVDWKMPGMDGIQLVRELKVRSPVNTIVIMISAFEWTVIAEEAKKAGVDKFLSKPLFQSSIVDVINECLGLGRKQIEETANIDKLFAGQHILLAEDVEINREVVLALLEPTQAEIDCAENGREAVRMFSEAPDKYDIIFMDVQMPEMDGYEATRCIRSIEAERAQKANDTSFFIQKEQEFLKETNGTSFSVQKQQEFLKETPKLLLERPKGVPIIAMTANVFREDIEKCLEAGMDDHIGKPLDFKDLIKKLRFYLLRK
jgi:CheY-like chemotaxis protein